MLCTFESDVWQMTMGISMDILEYSMWYSRLFLRLCPLLFFTLFSTFFWEVAGGIFIVDLVSNLDFLGHFLNNSSTNLQNNSNSSFSSQITRKYANKNSEKENQKNLME